MFGTADECDVVIPPCFNELGKPIKGISRRHCALTFDKWYRPIIRDLSSYGTALSYARQGGEPRCKFQWIIAGDPFIDKLSIVLHISEVKFIITIAKKYLYSKAYALQIQQFLSPNNLEWTELRADRLLIDSTADTRAGTGVQTPSQGVVYITEKELGRGAFSVVRRIVNVSSGCRHAGKLVNDVKMLEQEVRLMERMDHVSDAVTD